ncbi:hypothetical protein PVAG01_00102 [Phlyctema vagabunda]|uniref:ER-bound oxygenase mpaB/mpaB'/Rubber oxygenase catalytic domain-containing protein n=1 Tax=Phlyctema vagabunda TaxID=108571 RepID=A0ABR4PTR7_9HELO
METARKRGYKWIQRELDTLDPYEDYEQIFRLATSYGGNDFLNSLFYCLVFPNFIVTEHGARVVWREDGGKVLRRATARMEDTETSNSAWWWYGPSDERCRASVESINQLHSSWAKRYPGVFSHNDDYVYTLAFIACFMHRLRRRLGLSDVQEKVRIASHLFMRDMAPLFYVEGRGSIHDFPDSFDACLRFCEDYEQLPHPGSEAGHLACAAIFDGFAFRWFPPSLRWLGRALPTALSLPSTIKIHRMKRNNAVLQAAILWLFRLFWLFVTKILPDPQDSFVECQEALSSADRVERVKSHSAIDKAFAPFFASSRKNESGWSGCPYHVKLGEVVENTTPGFDARI